MFSQGSTPESHAEYVILPGGDIHLALMGQETVGDQPKNAYMHTMLPHVEMLGIVLLALHSQAICIVLPMAFPGDIYGAPELGAALLCPFCWQACETSEAGPKPA